MKREEEEGWTDGRMDGWTEEGKGTSDQIRSDQIGLDRIRSDHIGSHRLCSPCSVVLVVSLQWQWLIVIIIGIVRRECQVSDTNQAQSRGQGQFLDFEH